MNVQTNNYSQHTDTHLTVSKLIEIVRMFAQKHPESVYSRVNDDICMYTKEKCGDGVGCIFGQALLYYEPGFKNILEAIDNFGNSDIQSNVTIESLIKLFEIYGTKEEIDWCKKVQYNQDTGVCWSVAVSSADNSFTSVGQVPPGFEDEEI